MRKKDWYRNIEWTTEIRERFFARLHRSRSTYNKAQYLRIQAYHLQHDAKPPLYETALELLEYLIKVYPEPSQLASAYLQKAQCLEALGSTKDAADAYLAALSTEEVCQGVKATAPLDFAMFVIRCELREYYDMVLNYLSRSDVLRPLILFPIGNYQANAALAIILYEKGEQQAARKFALNALKAAQKTDSGFRYHPKIGLVENVDEQIHSKLEKIAGGG